jgi:hypothetical protein
LQGKAPASAVLFKTPAVHALLRRVPACALGDAALIRMSDQAGIASANCFKEHNRGRSLFSDKEAITKN